MYDGTTIVFMSAIISTSILLKDRLEWDEQEYCMACLEFSIITSTLQNETLSSAYNDINTDLDVILN